MLAGNVSTAKAGPYWNRPGYRHYYPGYRAYAYPYAYGYSAGYGYPGYYAGYYPSYYPSYAYASPGVYVGGGYWGGRGYWGHRRVLGAMADIGVASPNEHLVKGGGETLAFFVGTYGMPEAS